jgi:SAM-dependent methyltransferase
MKNFNFPVDVDNPKFKPMVDPIRAHSQIADFYKFRPPYLKEFFHLSSEKLILRQTDNLLDICCGRGELASGFSGYVNKILAVDGSEKMLANAIAHEKISYHLADINNQPLSFVEKVNHLVIGSAVHWIGAAALNGLIENNLHEEGKIFISHTLFKYDKQPYADALSKLNTKYGRSGRAVDLWGVDKLSASGFVPADQIRVVKEVVLDANFLYQNQLSYAYSDFFKIISNEAEQYKKEFFDTIKPYLSSGRLSATLVNWAVVYHRAKG